MSPLPRSGAAAVFQGAEEAEAFGDGTGTSGALIAGLVLAATALALAPVARALADRLVPGRPAFFARWGFVHAAVAVIAGFLAFVIVSLLPGVGIVAMLVKTICATLAVALLVVAFALKLHPEGLGALGFVRAGTAHAIALGLSSYLLLLPAWCGVVFAWPAVAGAVGIDVVPQQVLVDIVELDEPAELLIALGAAILIQPFLEELLFRGFLQPLLVQNFHAGGGIVVTSVLFALLHGRAAVLPIFALSLILGWTQLRTHRLVAAWLVHAVHNGVMVAVGLLAS